MILKILRSTFLPLIFMFCVVTASAGDKSGIFLVSPMFGNIKSDIKYTSPGTGGTNTLSDSGPISALMMMYTCPEYTLGSMFHFSKLNNSTENGYMFYGLYYFNKEADIRPMLGFYADYINVFTKMPAKDIAPLLSLNVNTSIWAFHPIAGVQFKVYKQKITPFIGYFNEQVETSMTSEGMLIAGQIRNGFSANSSVSIDYMTVGVKAEFKITHFIRFDTKVYARLKNGESPLFTTRNRLDFLLSRQLGISVKYDYFNDKYETNSFLLIGPVFVF